MSIIGWIVLGLIDGFIGSKVVTKTDQGLLGNILVGVIGAVACGELFSLFGI
jgi:uncharacterized membrane protein YeaQ/YmgE (transglycosylase-associated protein family)